ncbi:hypothetical protein [Escherichia coli]|uniref:hypothetical protein n=1 Tax=Escherichia coli TaxID=562 RepID=UPI00203686BE|nr:hypothetical protein [Escherichia coli]
MKPEKAIEILKRQREQIPAIQNERRSTGNNPSFNLWQRNTKTAISKIFGEESDHKKEFGSIRYSLTLKVELPIQLVWRMTLSVVQIQFR